MRTQETPVKVDLRVLSFAERLRIVRSASTSERDKTALATDMANSNWETPITLENVDIARIMCDQLDIDRSQAALMYCDKFLHSFAPVLRSSEGSTVEASILPPIEREGLLLGLCKELIFRICAEEISSGLQAARKFRGRVFPEAFVDSFYTSSIMHDLSEMAAEAFVYELSLAGVEGYISTDTPDAIFAGALALSDEPEYTQYFCEKYPVLVTRLKQRAVLVARSLERLLSRIDTDLHAVAEKVGCDPETLAIKSISRGEGDSHQGAESVCILKFTNGKRVVYKPRCVTTETALNKFLAWMQSKDPRLAQHRTWVIERNAYGWMEFVEQLPASDEAEVEHYHFRYGALMAAMYAVNGTDVHHENLIAHGAFPVIVDAETIFQPVRLSDSDPNGQSYLLELEFFANSPLYTAMVDPSELLRSIGGGPLNPEVTVQGDTELVKKQQDASLSCRRPEVQKSGTNNVVLNDVAIDGHLYRKQIMEGFESAYRVFLRHKGELVGTVLADIARDVQVRVIFKPTAKYSKILAALTSPYAGESVVKHDEFLLKLWIPAIHKPAIGLVVLSEAGDLWNGDIPYFKSNANTTVVLDSSGNSIGNVIPLSGLDTTRSKVARFSEATMKVDCEVIDYFLRRKQSAALEKDVDLEGRENILHGKNVGALLALLQRHMFVEDGRLHFVDLVMRPDMSTSYAPLPWDFYTGLAGVCFAFSYYGRALGRDDLLEFATQLSQVCFSSIDVHSEKIGACQGLGGGVYLAAHLSVALADPSYALLGIEISKAIGGLIYTDRKFDVFSGTAGALLSLTALYEVAKDDSVLQVIEAAVAHLEKYACVGTDGAISWQSSIPSVGATSGFAHGVSGIGYALLRARKYSSNPSLDRLVHGAAKFLDSLMHGEGVWREDEGSTTAGTMDVWCHGTMGIAIFYELYAREFQCPSADQTYRAAYDHMQSRILFDNDSACHGTLGNIDICLMTVESDHWSDLHEVAQAAISTTKAQLEERDLLCGNRYKHHSVSLFNGFCGMAYQMARMDGPTILPSFLRFDAPVSNR